MALTHPRDKTYKRFVFDPEDIGEPYPTIDGERVAFGDADAIQEAIQEGKTFDITRDIREGAKKIWVTFRVLASDDVIWMRDHVRQLQAESGDTENTFNGTQQKDSVRLAVVEWSLKDPPWNENTLSILDSDLFDQIYFWVRSKGVPDEQDSVSGLPLAPAPVTLPASVEPLNRAERRRSAKPASPSRATKRSTRTSPAATSSRGRRSSSATE